MNSFAGESLRYVKSALPLDLKDVPQVSPWLMKAYQQIQPQNFKVLDVGCGPGFDLYYLTKNFACSGLGLEPDQEAVNHLKSYYGQREGGLEFLLGESSSLSFCDSEFDLVICKSVLHWVPRERILQSLGELFRVSRNYVLLMDFYPSKSYRTAYRHRPGFWTFKTDYAGIVEAAKIAELKYEYIYCDPSSKTPQAGMELTKARWKSGEFDWDARKLTIWHKQDLFPEHDSSDFSCR